MSDEEIETIHAKALKCTGDYPPMDHPKVTLEEQHDGSYRCPVCRRRVIAE